MKTIWLSHDNTDVLLYTDDQSLIESWIPYGIVVLKQCYAAMPPEWHAVVCNKNISRKATREEARADLERALTRAE
jgi:hypothetical protein